MRRLSGEWFGQLCAAMQSCARSLGPATQDSDSESGVQGLDYFKARIYGSLCMRRGASHAARLIPLLLCMLRNAAMGHGPSDVVVAHWRASAPEGLDATNRAQLG